MPLPRRALTLVPDNFMGWLPKVIAFMGLWPPQTTGRTRTAYLATYWCFFVALALSLNLSEIVQGYFERDDLKGSLLNFSVVVLHLTASVRIVAWHANRRSSADIVECVNRGSFEFEHPVVERFRKSVTAKAHLVCFVLYVYMTAVITVVIAACYLRVFGNVAPIVDEVTNATVYPPRKLIFNSYFPFEMLERHFMVAWCYQMAATYFLMWQYAAIDAFIIGGIITVISQLRVLQKAFTSVCEEGELGRTQLLKCIEETQQLLRAADLLDSFNVLLLSHFAGGTLILCTLIYVLPLVDTGSEIFILTSIVAFQALESLFICWLSQSMTDEFLKLSDAVYEIDWTDREEIFKKDLVFVMMRLQKPAVLTLGRIANVNLAHYVNFVKLSYSFYTLLQKQRR